MDDLIPISRRDGGVFIGIQDLVWGCHPGRIFAVVDAAVASTCKDPFGMTYVNFIRGLRVLVVKSAFHR